MMMDARAVLDANMTEKAFSQLVTDTARAFGWAVYRTWNSNHSPAGYPDITAVRETVIYAELKTERGKITQAQHEWLLALHEAGQHVYLWRPSNWEAIVRVLEHGPEDEHE